MSFSQRVQSAAIVLFVLALAGCGEGSNGPGSFATSSPTAVRTPMAAPVVAGLFTPAPGSIYFGAYVNTSGLIGGGTPADTADLEAELNRTLTLHTQFITFPGSLSGSRILDDYMHFRVPVIAWNCEYPDVQIASGQWDTQIAQSAAQAKGFGAPMFVSFFPDANLPNTSEPQPGAGGNRVRCWDGKTDQRDGDFSPTEFIAAWQHVHTMFVNAGATNVIWVWITSADPAAQAPMQYYPGDQFVDWVGMDAFDLNGGSFASTFAAPYAALSGIGKPMMIANTGVSGAAQQQFFSAGAAALKSQFPQIKAFLYYDGVDYSNTENQDFRVAPSAFTSFSAFANDPYLAGSYVP